MPEEDTKYFGSFKDKTFFPTKKTILFVCETREEALGIEIKLHDFFDVAVNPQFANMAKATSTKFDTTGVLHTEEWKKAQSERNSGEKNPMFNVPRTKEWKKAHSEIMTGKTHTEAQKKANSERNSGEKHPNYGNTGALNPLSKAIIAIEPHGTQRHYGSIGEAAREVGINSGSLSWRLNTGKQPKQGKWKGWQFIYQNP